MKNAIVYGVIFLLAFGIVTGAIFFLNSKYKNIFAFDFSPETNQPVAEKKNTVAADSLKSDSTKTVVDSTVATQDSIKTEKPLEKNDQKDVAETKPTQKGKTEQNPKTKTEQPQVTENPMLPKTNMKQTVNKDSIYNAWLKQTVQLYEAMDSKKVAKVILGYSDNIARDLILRMRKKKAAEVLSEFKPEVVTRLISVN